MRGAMWQGVLWIGLLGTLPGCIVPRPDAAELQRFERGFETPEGAFECLRTAFQGEMLEWEYRCLSQGLRERNGLSQQAYRAFRPQFLARIPYLRWGLARAVVEEVSYPAPDRARLTVRIPVPLWSDPRLTVILVREEYAELYTGPWDAAQAEPLTGRLVYDPDHPGEFGEGLVWVRLDATRPLSSEELETKFTRLHGAREWKVDAILPAEEP